MSDNVVATGSLLLQTDLDSRSLDAAVNKSASLIQNQLASALTKVDQLATKTTDGIGKSFTQASTAGQTAANNISQSFTKALQSVQSGFNTLADKSIKGAETVIKAFGVTGAAALTALVGNSIRLGVEIDALTQKVQAGLTVFLGTTAAAQDLVKQVNALSATTPFSDASFLSAAQSLVSLGVSATTVVPLLHAVAENVAAIGGSSADIQNISSLLAEVEVRGVVDARTIRSLAGAGVNAIALVAAATGKTEDTIRSDIKAGTLSPTEFINAFIQGSNKNLAGATAAFTNTLAGAKEQLRKAETGLGQALTGAFVNPNGGGAGVTIINNLSAAITAFTEKLKPLKDLLQSAADGLAKISDKVKTFVDKISETGVQHFVDSIKGLAPLVAGLAGAFSALTSGALQSIPLLGSLVPELNPLTGLFAGFLLSIPAVRQALLDVGRAVITAVKPAIEQLIPAFKSFVSIVSSIATVAGPAFVNVIQAVAPLLTLVATALRDVLGFLAPVVKALAGFGPVKVLVEALTLAFIANKVASSGLFQGLATGIQGALSGLKSLVTGEGAAATESLTLKGAMSGLGSAIGGLVSPTNIAIAALLVLQETASNAAKKSNEAIAAAAKGLDLTDLSQANIETERLAKQHQDALDAIAAKGGNSTSASLKRTLDPINGFKQQRDVDALQKVADDTKKALDAQKRNITEFNNFVDSIQAQTGKESGADRTDIIAKLKAQGFGVGSVIPEQEQKQIDDFIKSLTGVGPAADSGIPGLTDLGDTAAAALKKIQDALQTSSDNLDALTGLVKTVKDAEASLADLRATAATDAADKVREAETALKEARNQAADTQAKLNDLEKQRNTLLADTGANAREVADAERELANERENLRQIDENITNTEQDLADLRSSAADQQSAADRAVERAQIALNSALRNQNDLQDKANESAVTGVNLAGLSLDQARAKLANARATLAAQQQGTATGTSAGKSPAELADEEKTKVLDVADARQALKDAIKTQGELQGKINQQEQDDQAKILQLGRDRQTALEKYGDEEALLRKLRAGDTQHAQQLRDIQQQIRDATLAEERAQEGITSATKARDSALRDQLTVAGKIKDAESAVELAKNAQALKTAQILGDERAINAALLDRIKINATLSGATNDVIRQSFAQALPELLRSATLVNAQTGADVQGPPLITDAVVSDIVSRLLADRSGDVRLALRAILQSAGLKIAGLASGGLVEGKPGPFGAGLFHLGEFGRREAVLPLQDSHNLSRVLHMPQVLNPVLAALTPTIDLRNAVKASTLTATAPAALNLSGSGGNRPYLQAQANQDTEALMQRAFVAALKEVGLTERGDISITVAPEINHLPDALQQRKMADAAKRAVEEALRGY